MATVVASLLLLLHGSIATLSIMRLAHAMMIALGLLGALGDFAFGRACPVTLTQTLRFDNFGTIRYFAIPALVFEDFSRGAAFGGGGGGGGLLRLAAHSGGGVLHGGGVKRKSRESILVWQKKAFPFE